jgi:hypothetical protein
MLTAKGAEVVFSGHIDAANPDLKPDMLRMRSAGADVIMPWSVNAGFLARILNTRGAMGWDVPVVGQTTLGSGQTKALLEKPEYWNKVYSNNFRNVCFSKDGKLPPRAQEFVERLHKAKLDMGDTLLWWIASWPRRSRRPAAHPSRSRVTGTSSRRGPAFMAISLLRPSSTTASRITRSSCARSILCVTAHSTSRRATAPSR